MVAIHDNPCVPHFTAPQGWMNDPYGVTWHDGEYHLFFQYVPYQNEWAVDCHWGHATSPDLKEWQYEGIALTPEEGEGCWSGTVVAQQGQQAAMFYTSVHNENPQIGSVRLARAIDDSWSTWQSGEVVVTLPEGLELTAFRDPYIFEDETGFHLLMAAGFLDGTAAILIFDSQNNGKEERLTEWSYRGVFASRHVGDADPLSMGTIWECPQFIKIGDQWALIFSAMEPDKQLFEAYALGTLEAGRFTPKSWGRLTYGPGYYAGSAFNDKFGAPCMIHWIRNARDPQGQWVGALSITQRLVIENGRLTLRPYESGSAKKISELTGEITAQFSDGELEIVRGEDSWRIPADASTTEFVIDEVAIEVFTSRGAICLAR